MQAQIRKIGSWFALVSMVTLATGLSSCATKKQTAFIDDPAEKKESAVPWNKPEKWESGGQLAGMTDRR